MKLYNTIYLANPHDKEKWEIVKNEKAKFISADSPHPEGEFIDELNDEGIVNWNEIYNSNDTQAQETIYTRVMENIEKCDALFLYVNNICKNITAIEVTYARLIGKPCYLFVNNHGSFQLALYQEPDGIHEGDVVKDGNGNAVMTEFGRIYESVWGIIGLPDIYVIYVDSEENTKEVVRKLLLLESPIEAMLIHEIIQRGSLVNKLIGIEPQYKIDVYYSDIAFPNEKLAIELDGHDYHKTKEQRTHDAKKDRKLISKGWTVLRFTGSEIYNDVCGCLEEIADHCGIIESREYKINIE